MTESEQRFSWVRFYQEFAGELLTYRDRDKRRELLDLVLPPLEEIRAQNDWQDTLEDRYDERTRGPLRDICPFTLLATFNRGITNTNRALIAGALASKECLGVNAHVPSEFDGIPVVYNQKMWFFTFEKDRQPGDIDALWRVFEAALTLADSPGERNKEAFIEAYNRAQKVTGVNVNLTQGLFWIRPERFVSLDQYNERYIQYYWPDLLNSDSLTDGSAYLDFCDNIMQALEDHAQVSNIPELSHLAWKTRGIPLSQLITEVLQSESVSEPFNPRNLADARRRQAISMVSRQGQPEFREKLLKAYETCCAITACDVESALDAAHIHPYRGPATNHVQNGLLLRADIHRLFDHGLIGIDTRARPWKVRVREELEETQYKALNGKEVHLPENPDDWPNDKLLRMHWKKAYDGSW